METAQGVGVAIDYVDAFRLLGHDYMASQESVPATWDPASAGAPAGRIRCTITAYQVDPGYELHDGDATFLPVGTDVYLVTASNGTAAAFVRVNGHWQTYTPLPKP